MGWNKKNYNAEIGKVVLILFLFVYSIAMLYYYFAFYISSNQWFSEGILQFNSYITQIFPGVESRSSIGEQKFANGTYIDYLAGISIISFLITTPLSIVILVYKKLWFDYSIRKDTYYTSFFSWIGMILIVIAGYYYLYFVTAYHSSRVIYSSIGATILNINNLLLASMLIVVIVDQIRFFIVKNNSTTQ
ncbi:hypothetical protein [Sulfuricurvum sp.]|uniref:hypothetical protein n=1 Tax=Sulfuricurvum sp. TaxID=2025608 RepID=UPI00260EA0E0|nr:hypothetical protein [Sulfuricurvum sp.]MDD4950808.1 hypothetical protein [Sulfuricurvum sp.]